jgi:predicted ABC-class ATPase
MDRQRLIDTLTRIDGRGYPAYKDIRGSYRMGPFVLHIDHVQADPFAPPSRIRVEVSQSMAGFPAERYDTPVRNRALSDYLTRELYKCIRRYAKGNRGTGKSGAIRVQSCGQEILARTSVIVDTDKVEGRLTMGMPAQGRRVLGRQAIGMFTEELPRIVEGALVLKNLDEKAIRTQVHLCEDQAALREWLAQNDCVAFVADGAILPRRSGVDDRPMGDGAVSFRSPDALAQTVDLPHRGPTCGMAVPRGITLITGGGYHGKSTLLRAIERGVYDHISGDGREYVVTDPGAMKIRAEDGRRVEKVDIGLFINDLPNGQDTASFSTENASGSTSQAANIAEAMEAGATALLLDEDTSATNFMIRDARMQRLIPVEKEPITPFIDRVRRLYEQAGISTVLVIGGSGDYFDVSDRVILMDHYEPYEVTERARAIASEQPSKRSAVEGQGGMHIRRRIPLSQSLEIQGRQKVKSKGIDAIRYGDTELQLDDVEQLVDANQTRALAGIIQYARRYMEGDSTLREIIERVQADIDREGLDVLSPYRGHPGEMARPRDLEIAAAFNRLRILKVKPQ